MSIRRFVQIVCQGDGCHARYPKREPMPDVTAKELRSLAYAVGWEVVRHTTGRDLCPGCRIREIQETVRQAEGGDDERGAGVRTRPPRRGPGAAAG